MKVSERIAELRKSLANAAFDTHGRTVFQHQLIQLEVDVVQMVQEARYEGYRAGLNYGLSFRIEENSKG